MRRKLYIEKIYAKTDQKHRICDLQSYLIQSYLEACAIKSSGHGNLCFCEIGERHYFNDGAVNEVIYPVKIASSKKASIIAVTRKKTNNLSKMADVLITVPNNEELTRMGAITSKYSSLIVSDLLYFGAIQKDFENIKDNLINTSILTRKLKLDDEE